MCFLPSNSTFSCLWTIMKPSNFKQTRKLVKGRFLICPERIRIQPTISFQIFQPSFGSHHLSCWKTLISPLPSLSLSRSEKHRLPSKPAIENGPITGLDRRSTRRHGPRDVSFFCRGSTGIGMRTSKLSLCQCPLYWPSWLHEKYPIVEQCQCHRWGNFDPFFFTWIYNFRI